jgi:hypothetical protein
MKTQSERFPGLTRVIGKRESSGLLGIPGFPPSYDDPDHHRMGIAQLREKSIGPLFLSLTPDSAPCYVLSITT